MSYLIDTSNIHEEREFATGCFVWIARKKDPNMTFDFLTPAQNEDEEEIQQSRQMDIEQVISRHRQIYEAIYTYAKDHDDVIVRKYTEFFAVHRELVDSHVKYFIKLVAGYIIGIHDRRLTFEIVFACCAHLSVYGYMSYKAKGLQDAVFYAISGIAHTLKRVNLDDKYVKLAHAAEKINI